MNFDWLVFKLCVEDSCVEEKLKAYFGHKVSMQVIESGGEGGVKREIVHFHVNNEL